MGQNSGKKFWWDNAAVWTQQIMENHYTRNLDAVMEWLADDVMWIGPIHPQYVYGKENIRNILEKEQDVLCEIAEYSYDILYGGNDICVTAGRLNPRTAANTGLVLSVIQRVTFVFALAEDHPQVIHIHVSNDWEGIDEDEVFPYRAGKEAFLYLQSKIAKSKEGSKKYLLKMPVITGILFQKMKLYISAPVICVLRSLLFMGASRFLCYCHSFSKNCPTILYAYTGRTS